MATTVCLKILGGFEARLPDGHLAQLGTRKAEALLAYLAYCPGKPHSRDRLASMFWGGDAERAARHSLRQALASLRRALPTDAALLRTARDTVALEAAAVDVDVVAFEDLRLLDDAPALAAAAQLYRGPLLDGCGVREELFEQWLDHERARLHAEAVQLLLRLADLEDDAQGAASALLRVLELDPLCEEAHRRLIRAHIDARSYSAAIRQYDVCAEALRRELDAVPEPQTTALQLEAVVARSKNVDVPLHHPEARADTSSGERKQVTVLCAALLPASNSDGLGDPEQAQAALGPVLGELRTIALRNGGSTIGETSDELIAIFGAPVARENHAANACRAGSDMAAALEARPDFPFRASIAIDSGEVVVRMRDESLLRAGVFGECLQRATRLARSARLRIGVTEATFALANRFWRFTSIDAVSLDAQAPSVPLYVPAGPWPGASGLDHFPAHLLAEFVGRKEQLAAIGAALAPALEGRGQMIAVVGEPGIGKSRLFHEFLRSVSPEWHVVACRGDPQLADAPYLPIARAVRACLGIEADRRHEEPRSKLLGPIRALDPTLEQWLPALSSLLELDVPQPAWEALEPAQKRRQIIAAAGLVFQHRAKRQPLLLVIEDLQWLDPASYKVLERLVEVLPASRILLLVNYRPEFVHDWGRLSFYKQIQVGPLSTPTTAEFVDVLLGTDASVASLRSRLISNTGGNPFFIEECIRAVQHSGVLGGNSGAFRAERELESLTLPGTVQAVIAARIDQLVPADRTLLRVAAVIGNEVDYESLRAVGELDEDALRAGLSRLQAAEFLVEMSLSPDGSKPSYRFKHVLTNDVSYNGLLQQTRRELHARTLAALEVQHAGRLDEHIETLAYHSSRGDVLEKSAEYGRRAGLRAEGRAAYRVAVARYGQALEALGRLPQTPIRIEQEIDLRFSMRNSLFVLGEHELIMEHLQRAEALAERTNDAIRGAYISLHIGGWFWTQGQQRSARAAAERALAIARDVGNQELSALAWYRIGQSHHASGEYRSAVEALLRSTRMLEECGRTDLQRFGGYPYAFCCSFLSWSFGELGEFSAAREWGLHGWRFASARNHTYTQSVVSFGLGLCYLREGSYDEARPILERGLELCGTVEVTAAFPWVAGELGYTYVELGQFERGFDLLRRALTIDRRHLHRARLELWLAEACLLSGRRDEASEAASRGLELAHAHGEQAHVACAERLLGDLASTHDRNAAYSHYARAIEIARHLELPADLRTAVLGRSRLLLAEGRVEEAGSLSKRGGG